MTDNLLVPRDIKMIYFKEELIVERNEAFSVRVQWTVKAALNLNHEVS